jgi:uncharacterized membrane protein YgdD (TMEM256/DUF423 family)
MNRTFTLLSAIWGSLGVSLGAMGAHGVQRALEGADDAAKRLGWWETAARYHLIHALALGLVAVLAAQLPGSKLPRVAGVLFVAGTLLFSGSLYVMALTNARALGAVTPFGGVCFITGWVLCAVAARGLPQASR